MRVTTNFFSQLENFHKGLVNALWEASDKFARSEKYTGVDLLAPEHVGGPLEGLFKALVRKTFAHIEPYGVCCFTSMSLGVTDCVFH